MFAVQDRGVRVHGVGMAKPEMMPEAAQEVHDCAPAPLAGFADERLLDTLDGYDAAALDRLGFGVIRLNRTGVVTYYNAFESASSGFAPRRVIGRDFFEVVAPCMNNFMVALRFEEEPELDAFLDYVLTLRMRPSPVRLRLLASATSAHRYVLVDRP